MRLRTLSAAVRRAVGVVDKVILRPIPLAVSALALFVSGYATCANSTVPLSQPSITVPAPTDVNTLGVVRVDVVAPPADVNCGSLLYVQVTGVFAGAQHITGACVSPDVATDARTDDVANALADEN